MPDRHPLSRFLADFLEAIPGVTGAIDDAVAQAAVSSNGHIPHVGSADD